MNRISSVSSQTHPSGVNSVQDSGGANSSSTSSGSAIGSSVTGAFGAYLGSFTLSTASLVIKRLVVTSPHRKWE